MTMALDPASSIRSARHPALARFINEHAIMRGRFKLVSGRESSYYCDGKKVSFSGEGLALIAEAIESEIRGMKIDAIGGMDLGATPIVAAVALWLHEHGRAIPSFVVRKSVKAHGTQKEIEGLVPENPARVVIVDDVVTSAGSIIKAIDVVRDKGHEVVLAISILDRESGGREALEAKGVAYQPLVTIAELGITNEEPD